MYLPGPHSQVLTITLSLLTHRAICPPGRLGRASFAAIGSSQDLQGPASTSLSRLEKNYKMFLSVLRSPASSPLHMNPESEIP